MDSFTWRPCALDDGRMSSLHDDEIAIDQALVGRLIAAQFPRWADLALTPVRSGGTDNVIFRLGPELAVRLPRHRAAAGQIEKEQTWLPRLAPHLPLAVPTPVALGQPVRDYPYHWSICPWLAGETALERPPGDLDAAARDLARFIAALQSIDAVDGPAPGAHNSHRGVPLLHRDTSVLAALAQLKGVIDTDAAAALWEKTRDAAPWNGPPKWLHGDLHPANLLVDRGRLAAVIDFGCLGVGDPACELLTAWTVLDAKARDVLRRLLDVDDASWARGRGWALSMGLIALPYYLTSNPVLVAIARRAISEALD